MTRPDDPERTLPHVPPTLPLPRASPSDATTAEPTATASRDATLVESVRASVPGYAIEAELGRGGMGVVYRARQLALGRPVALKMILAGVHASREALQRFQAEAEALARLQHPQIVQVFEAGSHQGLPFLSMELAEGGRLDQKLAAGPMLPREAAKLLLRLTLGVQAAHVKGIIHRDLKPSNILFMADGSPKIADFGLARGESSGQTITGAIMGTPSYMAPEQARGVKGSSTPATDVHALGAILYEMLTGRPPFQGPTVQATLDQVRQQAPVAPRRLQPTIPRDLEAICLKCLEKDSRHRYGSAAELADDLARFLEGRSVSAGRDTFVLRIGRWMQHPRRIDDVAELYLRVGGLGLFLIVAYGAILLLAWGAIFLGELFFGAGIFTALGFRRMAVLGASGAVLVVGPAAAGWFFFWYYRQLKRGRMWALAAAVGGLGIGWLTGCAAATTLLAALPRAVPSLDADMMAAAITLWTWSVFTYSLLCSLPLFYLACAIYALRQHADMFPRAEAGGTILRPSDWSDPSG